MVVALEAEARPLIDHFRLRRDLAVSAFSLYTRDDLALVVSGVGKAAAACAVGFLGARLRPSAWINAGTAGHADLPVGTVRLAHKVVDADSGQAAYPPLILDLTTASAEVITVSKPEQGFARDALYDMEASAFFAAARRLVTVEWIQTVKVVSDTRTVHFDSKAVGDLMRETIPIIEALKGQYLQLAGELMSPLPYEVEVLGRALGLTWQQRRQLEALLRKWQATLAEPLPAEDRLLRWDGQALLRWLRQKLHD